MAGYKTFNFSNQPLWVTVYSLPGKIQIDWGEVAAGAWRAWESGPYASGSWYQVRGEWPTDDRKFDVPIDTVLNGPNNPKPYVFIEGGSRAYWIRPCWRTVNTLDRPIWISIDNYPSTGAIDFGEVPARGYRDWFAGEYNNDTIYTLRAQSLPDSKEFDVQQEGAFAKGWGVATLVRKAGSKYEWQFSEPSRLAAGSPAGLPRESALASKETGDPV